MIIFFQKLNLLKKDLVNKTVKKLQNKNFVEEGYLDPPKGEKSQKIGKKLKDLFLNQQNLEMIQIEHYKKMMDHGLILQMMLLIILIK